MSTVHDVNAPAIARARISPALTCSAKPMLIPANAVWMMTMDGQWELFLRENNADDTPVLRQPSSGYKFVRPKDAAIREAKRRLHLATQPKPPTPPKPPVPKVARRPEKLNGEALQAFVKTHLSDEQYGFIKSRFTVDKKTLFISVTFPQAFQKHHSHLINDIQLRSAVKIKLSPSSDLDAVRATVRELIPARLKAYQVSNHFHRVTVGLDDLPDDWHIIHEAFQAKTGYTLDCDLQRGIDLANLESKFSFIPLTSDEPRLRVGAAIKLIKRKLHACSLPMPQYQNNAIILRFITPQKGLHHAELLQELATQVGYRLVIHPKPNLPSMVKIISVLCKKYDLILAKPIGFDVPTQTVILTPKVSPDEETKTALQREFTAATRWNLTLAQILTTDTTLPRLPQAA